MEINLTKASKFISLLLRHKPEVGNLTLDEHGWCDVSDLIVVVEKRNSGFSMNDLEEVVRTDEKQRYSFNENKTLIRANQGHSIPVDVELSETTPPDVLYHGTATKNVDSIQDIGLQHMSRLYVHLSSDYETAVKVGSRHGKPVVFTVDAKKMYEDGFKFYLSANGVWLIKEVPAHYLQIVQ